MSGGHYVRSKRGFTLVEELIQTLNILQFLGSAEKDTYEIFKQVQELYNLVKDKKNSKQEINNHWSQCSILLASFQVDLNKFIQKGKENSELFHYWDKFVNQIIPVARNLTQAHEEGNWPLYPFCKICKSSFFRIQPH